MSFFSDAVRGYRAGRAARNAEHHSGAAYDDAPPSGRGRRGSDDLAECMATVNRLLAENASLKAQLAQGQDQRDRAHMRELESILAFPGVRTALVKVLHPDTGTGGSTTTRKEVFQTLMAVMERLGIRG
jgi:hypothetical protein